MNAVGNNDNKNTAVAPTHVLGSFSIDSILNESNSKVVEQDGPKLPMDTKPSLMKADQRAEQVSPILSEHCEPPNRTHIGK